MIATTKPTLSDLWVLFNFRNWLRLVLAALILSACSPELNWRQVQGEHAHYELLLPGKPAQASRTIQLAHHKLEMSMLGTQAAGIQFVIAHVACSSSNQAQILLAMRHGLIQNLHAQASQLKQLGPELWQIQTSLPKPQLMRVKLFARENQCFQMLMLTESGSLPQEASETFFDSFKIKP